MRATPKRGQRLGGSASHQKAMLGNLVASLIVAEGITTTETCLLYTSDAADE